MAGILIIDDSTVIRLKLKQICEHLGHVVVGEAPNGELGVRRYEEIRPDIVFLDMMMPEMDGIEAANRIMQKDPSARIIIISGDSKDVNVIKVLKSGVKGYVLKPFHEERIIHEIQKALAG